MKFVDQVIITLRSGDGGNGCISFRRARFIPRGRPDGGDGGRGGDVFFLSDPNIETLAHLEGKSIYKAKNGGPGRKRDCHGAKGEDVVIKVPVGTRIIDDDTGELITYMKKAGEKFLFLRGGKGGRGNRHFVSSINRSPRKAEKGEKGVTRRVRLEFILQAEIAVIGLPNSGKTSLVASLTGANLKIAPYPFTTRIPKILTLKDKIGEQVRILDTPPISFGDKNNSFLKHLYESHTVMILFTLDDLKEKSPTSVVREIERVLLDYKVDIGDKKTIIFLTKKELYDDHELQDAMNIMKEIGYQVDAISLFDPMDIERIKGHILLQ